MILMAYSHWTEQWPGQGPGTGMEWVITARIRRMGKVMFSVCPHLGGYPYPIMLCNISQNAMGQTPGGAPCQVQPEGGYPARSSGGWSTLPGPARGYPARSSWGGTLPGPAGGVPCQVQLGGGGYQGRVPPRPGQDGGYQGRVPPWQGTPLARSGWGEPS